MKVNDLVRLIYISYECKTIILEMYNDDLFYIDDITSNVKLVY